VTELCFCYWEVQNNPFTLSVPVKGKHLCVYHRETCLYFELVNIVKNFIGRLSNTDPSMEFYAYRVMDLKMMRQSTEISQICLIMKP
jgi:hypothetical protein